MIIFPDNKTFSYPVIFDSHAHYTDTKFDEVRNEILSNLRDNGVEYVISCSVDGEDSKANIKLAEKYDYIFCAVGIHPENLSSNTEISTIKELASFEKCVAIGEIGLDYYFDDTNKEEQKRVFIEQIKLANELNLPVIVHDREAHEDTLKILKEYRPKGVVHCFSGSVEMAKEILKLGMYIGVGGVITFKNSKKLPDVVKIIPDDKLLVETDCPYLAPEPFRGKICNSSLIYYSAQKIAEIKQTETEEILNITNNNAKELFLR